MAGAAARGAGGADDGSGAEVAGVVSAGRAGGSSFVPAGGPEPPGVGAAPAGPVRGAPAVRSPATAVGADSPSCGVGYCGPGRAASPVESGGTLVGEALPAPPSPPPARSGPVRPRAPSSAGAGLCPGRAGPGAASEDAADAAVAAVALVRAAWSPTGVVGVSGGSSSAGGVAYPSVPGSHSTSPAVPAVGTAPGGSGARGRGLLSSRGPPSCESPSWVEETEVSKESAEPDPARGGPWAASGGSGSPSLPGALVPAGLWAGRAAGSSGGSAVSCCAMRPGGRGLRGARGAVYSSGRIQRG